MTGADAAGFLEETEALSARDGVGSQRVSVRKNGSIGA